MTTLKNRSGTSGRRGSKPLGRTGRTLPGGRTRDQVKQVLYKAFRAEFPQDTVDIADGYQDNIHVMVVSRRFDSLTERQRMDLMWTLVDATHLTDKEKRLISLLYPVSPAEMK